jgi:hypothetical protein
MQVRPMVGTSSRVGDLRECRHNRTALAGTKKLTKIARAEYVGQHPCGCQDAAFQAMTLSKDVAWRADLVRVSQDVHFQSSNAR